MKDPVQNVSRTALGRAIRLVALTLLAAVFAAGAALAQVNAYVASTGNTSVLTIDTATNTVTATVAGTGSRVVTLSPDGKFLYSTNFNGISKIDLATNTIVGSVVIGPLENGIALTSDGATAYTVDNGSGTVSVVDTATMTVTATLPIFPQTATTTPDGSAIWVASNILTPPSFPGDIAVIDPATNTFTTFTLSHGSDSPSSIAFTPNGAFAYLTFFGTSIVSVIDTATQTEVATITAGNRPFFVAVTPDGAFAYVANLLSNNVSIIDTATNTVVATVPVGAFPRALAFTPNGAFAYVTNFNDNTISVIDTVTQSVVSTFPAGSRPWGIVIQRVPNVPPVLASDNASVTVNEGQTAANTGTVTDQNHDTVTLTASVGSVINNGNGTWSWSFATSDGPTQSQTVTITGDDGQGGTSTTTFALVVNNVAPTIVSVSNNGPVIVGNPATITVTATDPAGANDPLTYSFDCDNNGTFEIGPQAGNSASCTFATAGSHTVNVRVADDDGGVTTGSTSVTVVFPPPSCASATASPNLLWPPNHKFVPITISGIVNPAPGAVTISVTSIFQDEPVQSPGSGNTSPDAAGVGTSTPSVRSERDGDRDGRVYHINFTATGASGSCTGSVTVGVPHDQGHGGPVDQGPLYNSTLP
ncbi:MAG TPA: beta-propeller fold lactonase family protein [Thermoanaerobaculia bacterium]|nr:beta-propeller fold lactonase family protein [Thermoanaerobaculia bacterium]